MDWTDVHYFLTLARHGSVRAAGAQLGVSHSTVARRVEALEARLATRLFDRSRDGYALTEAGRQMLPRAQRIEEEMSALERSALGRDERLAGRVDISCCDRFVARILLDALLPVCRAHPDIELGLSAESRAADLSRREADIAVRALACGQSPPGFLIGLRLAPITVASYVAEAHAERVAPRPGGLDARWVAFKDRQVHDGLVAQSSHADLPSWGAFGSLDLLVDALQAGLGIGLLPTYVGDTIAGLRRLDAPDLRHVADLWLLCHPDLRENARLRTVRACIVDAFRAHHALFAGEAPGPRDRLSR